MGFIITSENAVLQQLLYMESSRRKVLASTSQKGCGRVRKSTEKSNQDDQGHGGTAVPVETKQG